METIGNRSYIDSYEVKEEHGCKWLKVFYHDLLSNEYFNKTTKDYLLSLKNEHKYSILKYLKNVNKYENRKFEFLIEYPEIPGEYNRWKQSSNPVTSYNVEGFDNTSEGMHTSWPILWIGLKRSDISTTFIRGCSNGWWHYAIGAFTWHNSYTFPGPIINQTSVRHSRYVYLWVRVASFSNMFDFNVCTNYCRRNSHVRMICALFVALIFS